VARRTAGEDELANIIERMLDEEGRTEGLSYGVFLLSTPGDPELRIKVRRVKADERGGHVAVITSVPMEECPECSARWLEADTGTTLARLLRQLLARGAVTAVGNWERLMSTAS